MPSQKPLVYVAQSRVPRLVIFQPTLGFRPPFLAKLWDNRLMLRGPGPDAPLTVFYQRPGQTEGQVVQVDPTVAHLAYLLAHQPSVSRPEQGLDLTYSQVINAVYRLCEQGIIASPVRLQTNPLAAAVARAQQAASVEPRPDTGPIRPDAIGPATSTPPPPHQAPAVP